MDQNFGIETDDETVARLHAEAFLAMRAAEDAAAEDARAVNAAE